MVTFSVYKLSWLSILSFEGGELIEKVSNFKFYNFKFKGLKVLKCYKRLLEKGAYKKGDLFEKTTYPTRLTKINNSRVL